MARIIRNQRTADHFTIIANAAVRDERLSWKARGLLAWLLSHAEGWETSVKDLAKRAPDGKASVETGLQELEACGYLERRQVRDTAGQMGATEYHVTDEYTAAPQPENRVTATVTRFSVTGSPGPGSSDPKKNNTQKTTHQNTSSDALRASTAPPVDPSPQQQTHVPREDATGPAAADDLETSPALAGRDAARASVDPTAILDAAMLNAAERAEFRTWLREHAGATNPDGLVVSLAQSGDPLALSSKILQWRSHGRTNAQPSPAPRPAWCGLCDASTRLQTGRDDRGGELVRRCPDCHPASGHTPHGSGTATRLAQDAQLAATNDTGTGRATAADIRDTLPAGTGRRRTAHPNATHPTTRKEARP